MKLSDWMGDEWPGELPFDKSWPPFSFGFAGEKVRPATRLRVFAALQAMGAGGSQVGVFASAAPYSRVGLSLEEFVTLAELRGAAGGFALALGDSERDWLQSAMNEEIQTVTRELNARIAEGSPST
jgi:hypothetical protein